MLRAIALAATLGLFAAPSFAGTVRIRWNGYNSVEWSIRKSSGYSTLESGRTSGGSYSTETLPAGDYRLFIEAPGFKPVPFSVSDRGTTEVSPAVRRLEFHWEGHNSVDWALTDGSGRRLETYTTRANGSMRLDLAADDSPRYGILIEAPGFREIKFTASGNGTTNIEPDVGRLIITRKTGGSLDWTLGDSVGYQLANGRISSGSSADIDLAPQNYRLELRGSRSEEKIRIRVPNYPEVRVDR